MPTPTFSPIFSTNTDVVPDRVRVTRLRLPLCVPYKLAFGDVVAFDTMIAEVEIEGRLGWGEATILTGYTPETIAQAWDIAKDLVGALPGMPLGCVVKRIQQENKRAPFTATMFTTALEMALGHPILKTPETVSVPLLFGLNPTDYDAIDRELDRAFAQGYRTVKVKVGFDVEADLRRVRHIQNSNSGRMSLRIDGNQGYNLADGQRFASAVSGDNIELLEQPCHMDDWCALEEVIKVSNVPIMLDESIYGPEDIDRAADIGAKFVKLKLMKAGSLDALAAGLEHIKFLGMEAVLGNGVASDPGCWMETCAAREQVATAGEMNGFLRTREAIVANPMRVEGGAIQLPAGYWPEPDREKIERFTVTDAEVR